MMKHVLTPATLVTLFTLTAASCLPGLDAIEDRLNAELIIVGVSVGDRLDVRVDATELAPVATEAPTLRLHLDLPAGEHEGSIVVRRGDERLCTTFTIDVVEGDRRNVAVVDVRFAPACDAAVDPPDAGRPDVDAGEPDAGESDAGEPDAGEPDAGEPDAGEPDAGEPDAGEPDAGEPDAGNQVVVLFDQATYRRETPGNCGGQPCADELVVNADGSASLDTPAGSQTGTASEAAVQAVAALLTSTEADQLFATGGCPAPPQVPAESVRRKVLIVVDGPVPDRVDETVEITSCDDAFTSDLRAAFAQLRAEVFGS